MADAPPFGQRCGRIALKRFLVCVALWWLGTAAFAGEDTDVELLRRLSSGVLRWGGDAEGGAPFQLRDPQDPGRIIGFEVELVDALAAKIGERLGIPLRAEFVQYDWVSLPAGLEKGDFDCIVSGFEMTPENRGRFSFTRPYYIYTQTLAVRREDTTIANLADLRGRAVGTLSGSAAERVLVAAGVSDIVGFDGNVEPYLDLEVGRLDAVLLDGPIAIYYGATNPKLKLLDVEVERAGYGIALRREDALLTAALDKALGEILADGTWQHVLRRWHLWNADQVQLAEGTNQSQERAGLGFDSQGNVLESDASPPADAVDRNILAASAQSWRFEQYAPLLLKAAGVTVYLTMSSMVVAMVIGLLVAMGRLSPWWPLRLAAVAYVEFFRGVPLLLLLFFLYFGLSSYGVQMPAIGTAILGFGLTYGAYEAEVYRSAIGAVPQGQWEAARALGLSEWTTFWRIVFPQAFRTALAPMTNDVVALFKDTSLVSVIAVRELTKEYLILSRSSLMFVELGLLTAALYLAMSLPLGYLSRRLERRFGAAA
jgi:polar amino acid transport system substrate-binding protein